MESITISSLIIKMVFGAVILAFIYHLVIYFFNKDRLYFHYVIFLFHTVLYFFYISGFTKFFLDKIVSIHFIGITMSQSKCFILHPISISFYNQLK